MSVPVPPAQLRRAAIKWAEGRLRYDPPLITILSGAHYTSTDALVRNGDAHSLPPEAEIDIIEIVGKYTDQPSPEKWTNPDTGLIQTIRAVKMTPIEVAEQITRGIQDNDADPLRPFAYGMRLSCFSIGTDNMIKRLTRKWIRAMDKGVSGPDIGSVATIQASLEAAAD